MRRLLLTALLLGAGGVVPAHAQSAPGAPTNLTASSSGSTVTLQWTAPSSGTPPAAYVIEAGSSSGAANLANLNTGTTATSYSASGVPAGTYFVRVRAANASGAGGPSNEVTLVVSSSPCSAPGAPAGLTIVTNSAATVSLSWTAASGSPTTYIIEAGSTSGASNLASTDLRSTSTSFTTTGVANGTYFVRVRARNACGTSGASNEVVLTVGTSPAPGGVVRFNFPCSTQGALAGSGFMLICDRRVWRYATRADVPSSRTGYPSRPEWYPTLATSLGARATCPAGGVRLTYSPLPVDQLTYLTPYGAMIGDHVTPIDHGYISIKSLDKPAASRTEGDYVPITAAATGVITEVSSLGSPTSNRVVIDHGCGIYTVYMVINRLTGVLAPYADRVLRGEQIRDGIPIDAGAEFGRQRDNPLDFNVFDQSAWLTGLINVFSYIGESWKPYTADPTPYFTSSLGSLYESLSRRAPSPRWGKIDHDVPGTAQGSWFLNGTLGYTCIAEQDAATTTTELRGGSVPGKNSYSYCHLALSPHWLQPSQFVASIGWWSDPAGDFTQMAIRLSAGQPTPAQLEASAGVTVYELVTVDPSGAPPNGSSPLRGVLAVRVNADDTLTIEALPNATSAAAFTGFTANQRTYRR